MKRIVVGVDGSEFADGALRLALEEARVHGATLEVVMAWTWLDQHSAEVATRGFDPSYNKEHADATLAAIVQRVVGTNPGVELVLRTVEDLAARALLQAAKGADLLVVGSRGLGGFRGLLLGSVSQQVIHHAPCSVLVYRRPGLSGAGESV